MCILRYVATTKIDNKIVLKGDICITTLQELYQSLIDPDCTEVEITEEFADANFTYAALCDFVQNAKKVASDKRVTVNGAYYSELPSAVKNLRSSRNISEIIFMLEKEPSKFVSCIHELCNYYLKSQNEALKASNQISTMMMRIRDLEDEMASKNAELDAVHELHNETLAALKTLVSRVNFRYDKTVNPDAMFVAKSNGYNRVLYLKEISRVHYTDTLIYYMQEILKTLYSVPVRFVVIEPYYAYSRSVMYPTCRPHWRLTCHDVYDGNIFMAGYAPKVMGDVLQNASHMQYLIVLDRGGYAVPHIEGNNVLYVYTASDLSDVPSDVPYDRVLSYSEETMYIPHVVGFDELSLEEKIKHYSSFDVTKKLIDLLEEGR